MANNIKNKMLCYPQSLTDSSIHPAFMQFQFFNRKSIKNSELAECVSLYMPEQSSQPSTVSWQHKDLGYITHQTVNALTSGVSDIHMPSLGAVTDPLKRVGYTALSKASSLIGSKASAEDLMGLTSGKIANPYLTMLFKGVDFRAFSFVFKFTPFNEDDCSTIQDIIKTFRKNSLPTGNQSSAFLGYPCEVDVAYMWDGKENRWLNKFKRSVITKVDVDYTPNGMFSNHRNGMPTQITMSISLVETDLVLRGDVDGSSGSGCYVDGSSY